MHRHCSRAPRLRGSHSQEKGAGGGGQQGRAQGSGVEQDVVPGTAQAGGPRTPVDEALEAHEPELRGHRDQSHQGPVGARDPPPSRAVDPGAGIEDLRAQERGGKQYEKGAQGLVVLGQHAGRGEQERGDGGGNRGGGEPGGQPH